jgi:hypothetical protein
VEHLSGPQMKNIDDVGTNTLTYPTYPVVRNNGKKFYDIDP